MRKKSHISLSRFLVNQMEKEELLRYRKSFYIGSILPDCVPSFIVRRHTYNDTFHLVTKAIESLVEDYMEPNEIDRRFSRKLGEITHYLADYFTFPHNSVFQGNVKEHCRYEEVLKHRLKEYVLNENISRNRQEQISFHTVDELLEYISEKHASYLQQIHEVANDIQFIVDVCFEVTDAIVHFVEFRVLQDTLVLDSVGTIN